MTSRYRKYLFCVTVLACALILAAGVSQGTVAQSSRSEQLIIGRATSVTGDRFTVYTTTPRGVRVYAVTAPKPDMLRAIDDGFTQLFAIARRHGYGARLNHSAYIVFIARADRQRDSRGAYSPDIAVGAAQYAGSIYDKGGFIYAAGMVLELNHGAFVIAEHDRDLRRVSEVVRYEGEHLVLYHNDHDLYQRTADHSRGGGHPILQ